MKRSNPLSAVGLATAGLSLMLLVAACGGSAQTIDADGSASTADGPAVTTTTAPGTDPDDTTPIDAATPELAVAIATWNDLGLENYVYTFTRSCECPIEDRGPFRVFVADGDVDRVEWFGDEVEQPARTIPELHAAINETAARGREVSATFDALTGHPVDIRLDLEALAVDGGEAITITSFSSSDLLTADLESARTQWEASGVTDYEFTYRIQCFCPEIVRRVTVRQGEVIDVVDEGDPFEDWPGYTIEDLFAELENAVNEGAASIAVTYDEGYGFPSDYYIDLDEMMADEEQGVTVLEFTPLS